MSGLSWSNLSHSGVAGGTVDSVIVMVGVAMTLFAFALCLRGFLFDDDPHRQRAKRDVLLDEVPS